MKQLVKNFKSKTPKKWALAQRIIMSIGAAMVVVTMYPEYFAFLPPFVTKTISMCALLSAALIQFKAKDPDECEVN